jgi:SAM-dependent methyltransferase
MNIVEANCPVCNNSEYNFLFRDYNRRDNIDCSSSYVECKECSLVYLRDRPPWDDIVKYYSSLDNEQTANTGKRDAVELRRQVEIPVTKWKQVLRKFRFRPHSWPLESVQEGRKRLLDLGCGSGAKLFEFAERGYDVWGVDVGEDSIRLCKKLLPEGHFFQGELQDINFPDGHFDYIRIDNALEHVPNPKVLIKECLRLLCDGGQIMVYVPHGRSFSMRFMKGNSISAWIPFHLQLFTRKSLNLLLEEGDFKQICIYEYNPTSWLPLSIMQLKKQKNPSMHYMYPRWLALVCYPIGWLAVKFGIGEELVGTGLK